MTNEIEIYKALLSDIKNRVRQGQLKANLSVNAEMLATYFDIGRLIQLQQQKQGWGKGVIPKLAVDLKNELSEVKGFSERNLQFMIQFFNEYKDIVSIRQQPVSQLKTNSNTKLPVSQLKISEYELLRTLPDNLKGSQPQY